MDTWILNKEPCPQSWPGHCVFKFLIKLDVHNCNISSIMCSHFIFYSPYYLFFLFFNFVRLFMFQILASGDTCVSFYRSLKKLARNLGLHRAVHFSWLWVAGCLLFWSCLAHSCGYLQLTSWPGPGMAGVAEAARTSGLSLLLVFHPGFLQSMAVSGWHFKRTKVEAARPVRSSHRNTVFTSLLPLLVKLVTRANQVGGLRS